MWVLIPVTDRSQYRMAPYGTAQGVSLWCLHSGIVSLFSESNSFVWAQWFFFHQSKQCMSVICEWNVTSHCLLDKLSQNFVPFREINANMLFGSQKSQLLLVSRTNWSDSLERAKIPHCYFVELAPHKLRYLEACNLIGYSIYFVHWFPTWTPTFAHSETITTLWQMKVTHSRQKCIEM